MHDPCFQECEIIDTFLPTGTLKDEVLKIMPVQKQTRAGQRTRFKVSCVQKVIKLIKIQWFLYYNFWEDLPHPHPIRMIQLSSRKWWCVRTMATRLKEVAFKTLFRPLLECTRFVFHNYHSRSSVAAKLDHLSWPSLQHHKKVTRLSVFYKVLQNNDSGQFKVIPSSNLPKPGKGEATDSSFSCSIATPSTGSSYFCQTPSRIRMSCQKILCQLGWQLCFKSAH